MQYISGALEEVDRAHLSGATGAVSGALAKAYDGVNVPGIFLNLVTPPSAVNCPSPADGK
jgi:hypothetical protein